MDKKTKYFIDTEFHEYRRRDSFYIWRPYTPTIDLISIGIVCEDGREFYALHSGCNIKAIWNSDDKWLKENVLLPIFMEYRQKHFDISHKAALKYPHFSLEAMQEIFREHGWSRQELMRQIPKFIYPQDYFNTPELHMSGFEYYGGDWKKGLDFIFKSHLEHDFPLPEFYGYYSAYDWVVFCWIFGRMIELPKGFPMYCIDLKQMMDDVGACKSDPNFPYQDKRTEHNALEDARWNMMLYNYLTEKYYPRGPLDKNRNANA